MVDSQIEIADRYGNTIDIEWMDGTPESVITDAQKLRQVMHNLLDNANKFTRSGVIRIEAECLTTHKTGHTLEFRIFDTGIGIHSEFLDRIFNDFESLNSEYNRSTEGAGLGLSIARRMVQALNGKIGARVPKEKEAYSGSKSPLIKAICLGPGTVSMIQPSKLAPKPH